MRSLESNGLKMKDNDSLAMVMLPILETKPPGGLRKWELKIALTSEEKNAKSTLNPFSVSRRSCDQQGSS